MSNLLLYVDQQSSEFGIRPTGSTVCSTGGTPATQLSQNSELGYKPLPSGRKEFGSGTSLLPNNFNSELRTKNSELERSDFDEDAGENAVVAGLRARSIDVMTTVEAGRSGNIDNRLELHLFKSMAIRY